MMANHYGGFWRRGAAILIDKLVLYFLAMILVVLEFTILPSRPYSQYPDSPPGIWEYMTGAFLVGHIIVFTLMSAIYFTYFHAATGQTVHDADSEFGLMIKHATEPVKGPRTIAANMGDVLAELLIRMLDLDRDRRPANWYIVHEQLSAIYEAAEHPEAHTQQIRLRNRAD